eukprot:jgi/Picsp_1/6112/NSC_03466-R1_leukotriene a-4 hydrolase
MMDPTSFSNSESAIVTNTDFEIAVDFESKILNCWCDHTVLVKEAGCKEVVFDSKSLNLSKVAVQGVETAISRTQSTESLGTAISVPLPINVGKDEIVHVRFWWSTSPSGALGLQWLPKELTAGKGHPYLFTQCQAIHARTVYPCQDTPGAKFTYTAAVKVPKDFTAVMSAISDDNLAGGGNPRDLAFLEEDESSSSIFRFSQNIPISSYLFALAVGHLVYRDLTPSNRIWSEPEMIEASLGEFEDIPELIRMTESLAGPYVWNRYDLLVLPSSFPFGGMENANCTFVTPTLLAGDKSLVNVVAHEISHSWTGNLVTNAQWDGFWLNEGPTVYLERRTIGLLEGEEMFQFMALLGWSSLRQTVEALGNDHKYTKLVPDFSDGPDPDDAFSRIPYEKGFAFLYYIETLVGTDNFLTFFKDYISEFSSKVVRPNDFKNYVMNYFRNKKIKSIEEIDWDAWFYSTGMPPVTNVYDQTLAKQSFDLAKAWLEYDSNTNRRPSIQQSDLSSMSTLQIVAFIDKLLEQTEESPLKVDTIDAIENQHKCLQNITNAEIRCVWYILKLRSGDTSVMSGLKDFLSSQGRMKYLKPLYRALSRSPIPGAKEIALNLFNENKVNYHPIAISMCQNEVE